METKIQKRSRSLSSVPSKKHHKRKKTNGLFGVLKKKHHRKSSNKSLSSSLDSSFSSEDCSAILLIQSLFRRYHAITNPPTRSRSSTPTIHPTPPPTSPPPVAPRIPKMSVPKAAVVGGLMPPKPARPRVRSCTTSPLTINEWEDVSDNGSQQEVKWWPPPQLLTGDDSFGSDGEAESSVSRSLTPYLASDDYMKKLIICQRTVRRWVFVHRVRARVKMSRQRRCILEEIFKTEAQYLANLNIVEQFWKAKLSSYLTEQDNKVLFGDIGVLINIHNQLRDDLSSVCGQDLSKCTPYTQIGQIFVQFGDFLKIYAPYCNRYNEVTQLIRRLSKDNKKFANALHNIMSSYQCSGRSLESFLIMPVQRVPRINMLIDQLLKHTWETHPDKLVLMSAASKIGATTEHINEQKRKNENIFKVHDIASTISGVPRDTEIFQLGRTFIKEGPVIEYSESSLETSSYYLFLFNDCIFWTRHKKDKWDFVMANFFASSSIFKAGKIERNGLPVLTVETSNGLFNISGKTEKETMEWLKAIDECARFPVTLPRIAKTQYDILEYTCKPHKRQTSMTRTTSKGQLRGRITRTFSTNNVHRSRTRSSAVTMKPPSPKPGRNSLAHSDFQVNETEKKRQTMKRTFSLKFDRGQVSKSHKDKKEIAQEKKLAKKNKKASEKEAKHKDSGKKLKRKFSMKGMERKMIKRKEDKT